MVPRNRRAIVFSLLSSVGDGGELGGLQLERGGGEGGLGLELGAVRRVGVGGGRA